MFGVGASSMFDTEENIIKYMTSSFVDTEYRIEHNWKICFTHPYQYLEHPTYQDKREELQRNVWKHINKYIFTYTFLLNFDTV